MPCASSSSATRGPSHQITSSGRSNSSSQSAKGPTRSAGARRGTTTRAGESDASVERTRSAARPAYSRSVMGTTTAARSVGASGTVPERSWSVVTRSCTYSIVSVVELGEQKCGESGVAKVRREWSSKSAARVDSVAEVHILGPGASRQVSVRNPSGALENDQSGDDGGETEREPDKHLVERVADVGQIADCSRPARLEDHHSERVDGVGASATLVGERVEEVGVERRKETVDDVADDGRNDDEGDKSGRLREDEDG
ncbi:hypothetical protein HFX_0718 [Haloferax mediterranei ATCC 33500]|uniref:Uncharacterized protein n=1 Tax=Haloferax mediterranei (strain ATCC 33500 / DSM 1411 / JCM 8866 / NBRC 14739 / NCIMB 2177 / R-4) TaxID=523841 RepID=I3R2I0_HALMT|nr:hypothetical protein HFX_0718 [Haloferax mediterranei ATCC 33500]